MGKENKMQTYTQSIQKLIAKEIFVIITAMAILAICVSMALARENAQNQMENQLNSYQKQTDNYMATLKGVAEGFALSLSTGEISGYDAEVEMAGMVAQSHSGIGASYFAHPDNTLIYYSVEDGPQMLGSETEWTQRGWYIGAVESNGEVYVTDPYIDKVTGTVCVTISKEVNVDGDTLGVVGIDFYLDEIVELIAQANVGNGYLILTGADGSIMVHPHEEYVMTADMTSMLAEVGEGKYRKLYTDIGDIHTIMDYSGGLKMALSSESEVSGWILVVVKPIWSIYGSIFVLILLVIVACVIANIVVRKVNQKNCSKWCTPIEAVSRLVPELAAGNLEVSFAEEKEIQELDTLNRSLNATVKQLKCYIEDIQQVVAGIAQYNLQVSSQTKYKGDFLHIQEGLNTILDKLNDIFAQVDKNADTLVSYASQIQQSSEMVAQGATQQATAVADLEEDVLTFASQISAIVENADTMILGARSTNAKLEEGGRQMEDLQQAMLVIEKTTNEIDGIMQTINSIAVLTNLLCLKASIEAARAG